MLIYSHTERPIITANTGHVKLSIVSGDEQVILKCVMTSDIIGTYWERVNISSLPNESNITNISSLSTEKKMLQMIINNARPTHTGMYRCVAYNQFGRDQSRNVRVTITSKSNRVQYYHSIN